jgi:molybdopterin-guanine dinucleotide biosynthesis protein B
MVMKIIQFVGYKNSGKTTLVCEIVRELTSQNKRVGTLKSDAHDLDPDTPGKDTWQHRQAGAHITAMTSPSRTAWVQEQPTPLDELVSSMENHFLDALIIEGFKSAAYPKIVIFRTEQDVDLLSLPNILAAVIREPNEVIQSQAEARSIPVFIQPDLHSFSPLIRYLVGEFI